MKPRRRGRNVAPGVGPGFRLSPNSRRACGGARKPSRLAVNSCNFCLKNSQIPMPSVVVRGQSLAWGPAVIRKSLQSFLGRGETDNHQVMNILRNSRSGQCTYCVGKAYGIAVGGCCSHIAFVVNNQALTSVGTPCAFVVGASWHGAREEEIKELKK